MTIANGTDDRPLWWIMEEEIRALGSQDLGGGSQESAVQRLAASLDERGLQVSKNAGHMLALRRAVGARIAAGRPLLEDLQKSLGALRLEDLESTPKAAAELIRQVGADWPELLVSERRAHVLRTVEDTKLSLLVAKAADLGGETGIRFLIEEGISPQIVVERLGVTREEFDSVMARVEAERAERARAAGLLKEVGEKAEAEKIRHLITRDVSAELIQEMMGLDGTAVEEVRQAMEEEMAEKRRREEEAAAKRATEAAGPALEDIAPDEMLDHIDAIREILEFSDVEKEIRVMCEQSGVPQSLADIAVSDPGRLDELEAQAGG